MDKSNLPCPLDGCESSDAYTEYADGHGWCFSCGRGNFPKPMRPEELTKVYADGFRGVPAKVCEKFGIHTYVDEAGNPILREYVYPEGSKFRTIASKKFRIEGKVPALGGMWLWNAGQSHYVTVVEGEEDAAAAYHMLSKGKTTYEPIVWLTSATIPQGPKREEMYQYLSKFETVKFCFENDKAGRAAKEVLCQMLPNKVKEVSLTKYKDANEYLLAGEIDEFKRSWNNALVFTPDNIYHSEADLVGILNDTETETYYETSFKALNQKIKGIPLNHVTLITGMEGLGKTELLRSLEWDALRQGIPVAILHLEETKLTILKGLACYPLEKNARNPDVPVPKAEVLAALREASNDFENLFVFEFKQDPDVSMILEQINYLVHVCGVKYIFIDPINQFDPVDDTSRVEFLDDLVKKVAKYVANNPVGVVWTAHVDDEGRTRNSRMISKACSIRIDIKRDLTAEDDDLRNTTFPTVSKNRPFSKTGPAGQLFFDESTFTMQQGFDVVGGGLSALDKNKEPF